MANEIAGIAGLKLSGDQYDLDHGVVLRKDYAHLVMNPRITFTPSETEAHRGPWRPLREWLFGMRAGYRVTVLASISCPAVVPQPSGEPDHPTFWIVFLLSLQANTNLAVAYYFEESSDDKSARETRIKTLWEGELPRPDSNLSDSQIEWVRLHWLDSIRLTEHPSFLFAIQALSSNHTIRNRELQLVSVWSALERFFSSKDSELRFRVSTNIASYLEPNGSGRRELYRSVMKLYDERSRAAHGSPLKTQNAYEMSIGLLRKCLIKMIEEKQVPTAENLDVLLFE